MPVVNEELAEKYLRHSLYLMNIEKAEARRMGKFLQKEVIPVIEQRLSDALKKFTVGKDDTQVKRLSAALESLQSQLQLTMARATGKSLASFKSIGEDEVKWNVKTLKDTIPLDIDLFAPSAQFIHSIVESQVIQGHKLQTWLKAYGSVTQKRIMKATKIGIAAGESIPQIGRRIRGVLNLGRKRAEWLARTTVAATVNNVKDATFRANAQYLMGEQWVSTLDTRTTEFCIHQDGKVYQIGDGPRPPGHFNCRSTMVPLCKSWQEFGLKDPPPTVRSSMNGYVPEKMQYMEWLNKAIGAKPGSVKGPNNMKADVVVPPPMSALPKDVKPPAKMPAGTKLIDKEGDIWNGYTSKDFIYMNNEYVLEETGEIIPANKLPKSLKDAVKSTVPVVPKAPLPVFEPPKPPPPAPVLTSPLPEAVPVKPPQIQPVFEAPKAPPKITSYPSGTVSQVLSVPEENHIDGFLSNLAKNYGSEVGTSQFQQMAAVVGDSKIMKSFTLATEGKLVAGYSFDYMVQGDAIWLKVSHLSVMKPGKGYMTELVRDMVQRATSLQGVMIPKIEGIAETMKSLGFMETSEAWLADKAIVSKMKEAFGLPKWLLPKTAPTAAPVIPAPVSTAKSLTHAEEERAREWLSKLTYDEKEAIRVYTGSSYGEMKEMYWKWLSKKVDVKKLSSDEKYYLGLAKNVESALQKSQGYKGELWRGMKIYSSSDKASFAKHYKQGNTVSFVNANSFSTSERIANNFANWTGSGDFTGVRVKIHLNKAPKNSGYIESITKAGGEDEVLIGADNEYKVTKLVEEVLTKDAKKVEVWLELVEK